MFLAFFVQILLKNVGKPRMNTKSQRAKRPLARSMHNEEPTISFSRKEKKVLAVCAAITVLVTIWYWTMGGRNIFVFPALICIGLGMQKIWDTRKFWQHLDQ